MYHIFFIHSSADGHSDCLPVLATELAGNIFHSQQAMCFVPITFVYCRITLP